MNPETPAPNDLELMQDFLRVQRTLDNVTIEVLTIDWKGPHTPASTWKPGAILAASTPEEKVQQTMQRLLKNRRYFRLCRECQERNSVGWMLDHQICQGCAQNNHGIVF